MSGDVLNGNTPGWVRAVSTLGLATVLSLAAAYFVGGIVNTKLDKGLANDDATRLELTAIKGLANAHADAAGRVNAEILFYLRALCVQNARNAGTDPRECVPRDR